MSHITNLTWILIKNNNVETSIRQIPGRLNLQTVADRVKNIFNNKDDARNPIWNPLRKPLVTSANDTIPKKYRSEKKKKWMIEEILDMM